MWYCRCRQSVIVVRARKVVAVVELPAAGEAPSAQSRMKNADDVAGHTHNRPNKVPDGDDDVNGADDDCACKDGGYADGGYCGDVAGCGVVVADWRDVGRVAGVESERAADGAAGGHEDH